MKNNNDKVFQFAKKIKGYGSFQKNISDQEIEKKNYKKSGSYVKPKIIRNWSEYFSFIQNVESSYINPVFLQRPNKRKLFVNPKFIKKKSKE